jgi:hypothetical protein
MTKPTTKRKTGVWLALAGLLVGIAYVGVGLWALSQTSSARSSADAAIPSPTAAPVEEPSPTPTQPAVPTATPQQLTVDLPPGERFDLTIVHSNDTWGYTLPCG